MTSKPALSNFYVLGGTLTRDAPSYVQRKADMDLQWAIGHGYFCYVLTSRQMGKSSLMVRTAVRLRQLNARVAVIDLTALGQNLTAEQWYLGLVGRIGSQVGLEDEVEDYWDAHAALGPLQRWMGALREVVLARTDVPLVIFIDEIDATRSLPFSTDEFFAGIRETYNGRSETPQLERLTFCLLGVATPSDLIQDTRTTPFNIGQRIDLTDFTEAEARVLLPGLNRSQDVAPKLLQRILYWTGGHPYLTQRLCQAVGQDASVLDPAGVDRVCDDIFLSTKAQERDDNLLFVRDRMLRSGVDPLSLLTVYSAILRGKQVKDDPAHPLHSVLRLAGVVRIENGYLRVRNRIYERVFNKDFIVANEPLDEVKRQRAAERRGVLKVLTWASLAVSVFAVLAFVAWQQKRQAQALSTELEKFARSGLATTSEIADEIYAASKQQPELVSTYLKTLEMTNRFEETLFRDTSKKTLAANLETYNIYLAADSFVRAGDREKALDYARRGLARAAELEKDSDLQRRAVAARTYAAAAEIQSRLGDRTQAEANSRTAERMARELSPRVKGNDDFTLGTLALTFNMLGMAAENLEQFDRAVASYEQDINIHQKVQALYVEKNDQRIVKVGHDALDVRNRMGRIEFARGHYDLARQIYEDKSLRIASNLVALNENNPSRTQAQRSAALHDLWDVQVALANVLAARKITRPDALKYYQDALATGNKLLARSPNPADEQELERNVAALAKVEKLMSRYQGARDSYKKHVALVEQRATGQPGAASSLDASDAYQKLANFELHHGDKRDALSAYQNARQWLSKAKVTGLTALDRMSIINRKLGDLHLALGRRDLAREHYSEAARATGQFIELVPQEYSKDLYGAQLALRDAYQSLAYSKQGLGDHDGVKQALQKSLDTARATVDLAKRSADKRRLTEAYAGLAWAEVLNQLPGEAVNTAWLAINDSDKGAWKFANLAHAYLLSGKEDQARAVYLAHAGEETNDDLFEVSVSDDFELLRKLGIDRPEMAMTEKLLAK